MELPPIPETYVASRDALQRVAVHVVARARSQAGGRFGLRVTSGGFGTPSLGDDVARVRVSDGLLVRESAGIDGAHAVARAIDGATLAELAALARVDLTADLDVGHDTPPVGDPDVAFAVDAVTARLLGEWYRVVATALDRVVAGADPRLRPSAVQLWPEHFDVALDIAFDPTALDERRVNVGGSPGDGFLAEPYAYVGPWTDDRPGDDGFWNAPFGAVLGYGEIAAAADPVRFVTDFFERGLAMLGGA